MQKGSDFNGLGGGAEENRTLDQHFAELPNIADF
jgi:hypothetical protein